MPRPPLWYLQKVDLFADMSDEEIMDVIEGIVHRQFPSKTTLYTPNEQVENTYILKEGEVTLYQIVDGRKVIIDILKPGSIFGNIGLHHDEVEGNFAEVSENAFVCTFPENFFVQLLKKRPDIAQKMIRILGKRITEREAQLRFLSALHAKDRILATVKLLNQKDEKSILPPLLRMPTRITHEKLASMTGLTRETVTKQLKELSEEGMISINRKHIRLSPKGRETVETLG